MINYVMGCEAKGFRVKIVSFVVTAINLKIPFESASFNDKKFENAIEFRAKLSVKMCLFFNA